MKKKLIIAITFIVCSLLIWSVASADNRVQDPYEYMQKKMSFSDAKTSSNGSHFRSFSAGNDVYELISGYVNALVDSGTFSLTHQTAKRDYSYSWVLTYLGTDNPGPALEEMFDEHYSGHVMIWYQKSTRSSTTDKGNVYISSGLIFDDLGYRSDGTRVSTQWWTAPASVSRQGDVFTTNDGRFSVKLNQAQGYIDRARLSTNSVSLERETKLQEEHIRINDLGNCSLLLRLPTSMMETGASYGRSTLGRTSYAQSGSMTNPEAIFSNLDGMVSAYHGAEGLILFQNPVNAFENGFVRILLWDEGQQVAVVYGAFTFTNAPKQVEFVYAFSIPDQQSIWDEDAETVEMRVGDTITLTAPGRFMLTNSDNWAWQIIEGKELITLTGDVSQNCHVTALREGTVRLVGTYTYTYEGDDNVAGVYETIVRSKEAHFILRIGAGSTADEDASDYLGTWYAEGFTDLNSGVSLLLEDVGLSSDSYVIEIKNDRTLLFQAGGEAEHYTWSYRNHVFYMDGTAGLIEMISSGTLVLHLVDDESPMDLYFRRQPATHDPEPVSVLREALQYLRYLCGENVSAPQQDYNADGRITIDDIHILLKRLQ